MKKYSRIQVKTFFIFLAMTLIVSVLIGTVIYEVIYSKAIDNSEKQLLRCSDYVGDMLSAGTLQGWLDNGEDAQYLDIREFLVEVKEAFGLEDFFIYKLCYDEDGNLMDEVIFLFDIMPDEDYRPVHMTLGQHETGIREFSYIKDVVETGEHQITEDLSEDETGPMLLAFDPIKDKDGKVFAVVSLGDSLQEARDDALAEILKISIIYVVLMSAFVAFFLFYMHRGIIKPVNLLSNRMDHFVSDFDEEHYIPVTEIKTGDEIEKISDAYNKMSESILTYTNDLKEATAEQERLKSDFAVADSVRSATSAELSYPAFPERSDFDLYASLSHTVSHSCSFCNYIMTDEDHLYIVIGESVGNTLPALLMSMLASTNIRCLAKMGYLPYRIAAETNDQLCALEHNDSDLNVSILIAQIELKTGILRYVNAGMPPMLVKCPGEAYKAEELTMQFNLGEMRGVSFDQKQMTLQQGSSIILTSYGVSDMKNADGERFTAERVEQEINDIGTSRYYLNEMIDELDRRLDEFRGDSEIERDTTIVGFRYFG